jgi:hypothetical protein
MNVREVKQQEGWKLPHRVHQESSFVYHSSQPRVSSQVFLDLALPMNSFNY